MNIQRIVLLILAIGIPSEFILMQHAGILKVDKIDWIVIFTICIMLFPYFHFNWLLKRSFKRFRLYILLIGSLLLVMSSYWLYYYITTGTFGDGADAYIWMFIELFQLGLSIGVAVIIKGLEYLIIYMDRKKG